ncbi:MAG: DUF1631 family protein [Burkholderiaceae bacterium]
MDFGLFADELLASVPSLAVQACDRAHAQLQGAARSQAVAGDRQHTLTVLEATRPGVRGLAAVFSAALREQLRDEVQRAGAASADPHEAGAEPSLDSLTLVDDAQIEEDIEVARVIQLVDTACDADLRDLRALLATLRGANEALAELHPMRPEVCARALVRALHQMGLERGPRLMALRVVGRMLAEQLQALYRQQLAALRRGGVQPVAYRLRVTPEAAAAGRGGDAPMRQLAGRLAGKAAPGRVGGSAGQGPGDGEQAAAQLIPKLLRQVCDQSGLDETLSRLLARLGAPAIRSVDGGAGVLSSFEHPVWRLVDRMAQVAAVHSGRGPASARLAARLEPVIARLERMAPVSKVAFELALSDVDDLASEWADAQLTDAGVLTTPEAMEPGGSAPTDWGGASLPTVPMALSPDQAGTQHAQWWDGLREGALLRLFQHARWSTLRVCGCTRTHVLLGPRHGPPNRTLSRRALLQLRELGLATSIDAPQPVRQAVDTLTLDLGP